MLDAYLKEIGVRPAQIVAVSGLSYGTLSDLCSGRRSPSVRLLRRLLQAIEGLTGGAHPTEGEIAALLDSMSLPRGGDAGGASA